MPLVSLTMPSTCGPMMHPPTSRPMRPGMRSRSTITGAAMITTTTTNELPGRALRAVQVQDVQGVASMGHELTGRGS